MYPWGGPPRVSSRGQSSPRDLAPPITFFQPVGKTPARTRRESFQFCSVLLFKMVSSLSSIVLYSMPIAILFESLKMLWHLPIRQDCLRALFRRCGWKELRDWAKTLPWDHPVARSLDKEVHRRKMAGESLSFVLCLECGFFFFLIPLFVIPRCIPTL